LAQDAAGAAVDGLLDIVQAAVLPADQGNEQIAGPNPPGIAGAPADRDVLGAQELSLGQEAAEA